MQLMAQATIQVTQPKDLRTKPITIGTTTELAIFPQDARFEARDFLCRVSTATLTAGGDFTKFDGYHRILALVSGAGMQLQIDGTKHSLTEQYQTIRFPGDVPTTSKLLGESVADFNVIFRPVVDAALGVFPLTSVFTPLRHEMLGAPSRTTARADVLWSPDAAIEVEAGQQRVAVEQGGVFLLQHARRFEMALQVRATRAAGTVLLTSLRLPIVGG